MLFSILQNKYNISFRNVINIFFYLKNEGVLKTYQRTIDFISQVFLKDRLYAKWINLYEKNTVNSTCDCNDSNVVISIVVPVYNTDLRYLNEMYESVLAQTYSHWELCIADGNSYQEVRLLLLTWQDQEPRVRLTLLDKNLGIAENSNAAIALASGDFVAFLDHDDTLAPHALCELIKVITRQPDTDFIYSDEDKLSEDSKLRFYPHFKPDWSPDTLRSCNYVCHFTAIKQSLLEKTGMFRTGFEGSQDYDLFLRATERAANIAHIPNVLYHWRATETSTSINPSSKSYAYESGKKALSEHLARIGLRGQVDGGATANTYEISYYPVDEKVSIIIPNRDHYVDLSRCIKSILEKTTHSNYEIIIIDNGSTQSDLLNYYKSISTEPKIRILHWNAEFNYSSINNYGASVSDGSYLLFLNNDTLVVSEDWIERMLEHASRPDVGATGAKLYYGDGSIQHSGVVIGMTGIAGHAHRYYPKNSSGYMERLRIVQNVSAVTGACMLVRRSVYNEVNGFDETYQVAYGDIDMCLKIRACGYLIVWTPYAELYHYESRSRGAEDTPEKQQRLSNESRLFNSRWQSIIDAGDPYYNKNLTLETEDFSLKFND
jgi:GT2 family glycosyltransferase